MALLDKLHRFTVDDYLRLAADAEDGLEGTELVEGVVYDVSLQSSLHARAVVALFRSLSNALPDHDVLNVGSIEVGADSMWDPDVYVLKPDTPDRKYPIAADVELVVEVSLTTLVKDLGARYRGYAKAGIASYWVLAPQLGGYLLRHAKPADGRYQLVERVELPAGYRDLDVRVLLDAG